MKQVKLTARLQAIADMIDDGAAVADIGTDHGYLPVYLVQKGSIDCIIASDISAASLEAARRSAAEYNVTESIMFLVAPGLEGIAPADVDTIVIAGVGGETILGILDDAPWTKNRRVSLILQPQTKIDVLTDYLNSSGYDIKQITPVIDRGKHYTIIQARGGIS